MIAHLPACSQQLNCEKFSLLTKCDVASGWEYSQPEAGLMCLMQKNVSERTSLNVRNIFLERRFPGSTRHSARSHSAFARVLLLGRRAQLDVLLLIIFADY